MPCWDQRAPSFTDVGTPHLLVFPVLPHPLGFLCLAATLAPSVSFFLLYQTRNEFVLGTFSNLWKRLLKGFMSEMQLLGNFPSCQVYVQRVKQTIQPCCSQTWAASALWLSYVQGTLQIGTETSSASAGQGELREGAYTWPGLQRPPGRLIWTEVLACLQSS